MAERRERENAAGWKHEDRPTRAQSAASARFAAGTPARDMPPRAVTTTHRKPRRRTPASDGKPADYGVRNDAVGTAAGRAQRSPEEHPDAKGPRGSAVGSDSEGCERLGRSMPLENW